MSQDTIEFQCRCGKSLKVSADKAGKMVKCGGCGNLLRIPAASPAEEPAPPASAIRVTCPHCQQECEAPAELAGAQVECPACQQVITVPIPEQPRRKATPVRPSKPAPHPLPTPPAPTKNKMPLVIAVVCVVLVALVAGGIVMLRKGSSPAERSGKSAPDALLKEASKTLLIKYNQKVMVPSPDPAYALRRKKQPASAGDIDMNDDDTILKSGYYFNVTLDQDKKIWAVVAAMYQWAVASNVRVVDIVKVDDSDLFAKEAVLRFDVTSYEAEQVKLLHKEPHSKTYITITNLFKESAYPCKTTVALGDARRDAAREERFSDAMVRELDEEFADKVMRAIVDAYTSTGEDTSAKYGKLLSREEKEIRFKLRRSDKKWILAE